MLSLSLSFLVSFKLFVLVFVGLGLAKLLSIVYAQCTYWKKRGRVPYLKGMPVFGTSWRLFLRRVSLPDHCKFVYDSHPCARYVCAMDFSTPCVVIRDPKLIREIAIKNFDHFPDHQSFINEKIDPIFGKNVFSLRGDRWREMRNTLTPSFTTSKMRFIYELVSRCSLEFVDYLYDHPDYFDTIEAKDAFTRYTNDTIATVAFGISVNSLRDPENEFYKKGADATNFAGLFRLIKYLLFRMSPRLTRMAGFSFLSHDTATFFKRIVLETVRARDDRRIVRPDMIQLLMEARDKEKRLTIDDITAQAFIFFLAGFETSSTLMCYMAHELAVNPDVQARLRDEVDECMRQGDGKISYEAMSRMRYMEMVTLETLRKYPPLVLIDRLCARSFELPSAGPGYDKVTVHPDNVILFPVYGLHRDHKHFPEPDKFDPERFSEENKDKIDPYAYLPFGLGPRKCIGSRFALMETKILIVHLLHRFRLMPTEKTKVPIEFSKRNFSISPDDGFSLGLERRTVR